MNTMLNSTYKIHIAILGLFLLLTGNYLVAQTPVKPLRIGIDGLSHDHVHWLLGRPKADDIVIVGISEPNQELVARYQKQYDLPGELFYNSLEDMVAAASPEAVTAFGPISEHLSVVEICAPKGIHVMVEKPLAINLDHAKKMAALAKQHQIHLLTNYETTWYASNHKAYEIVTNGQIGPLRKMVVHDGHKGPKEIGISSEFLDWLTDPKYNGAGALTDFGCYGANLITWMMNGERPLSVSAVVQTIKPDIYPKVDDEATIILKYPSFQGIIQASWNWPIARKDMEVYGKTGQIFCKNGKELSYQLDEQGEKIEITAPDLVAPRNDPFALLAGVVRGTLTLDKFDLNSLENNMIVVEILEAAMKSGNTGQAVKLDN